MTLKDELMELAERDSITIYVSGETLARLRRISVIDGRTAEDLALQAVENAASDDMRGDFLRSA